MRRKVMVFVYRTEPSLEVLLLKRRKKDKGEWHPVTGNVEAHEPIPAAAVREVEEETGFAVVPEPLGVTFTFDDPKRKSRYHETAFAAKAPAKPDLKLSDEHEAHEWLGPQPALAKLHWPEQRKALEALVKRYA